MPSPLSAGSRQNCLKCFIDLTGEGVVEVEVGVEVQMKYVLYCSASAILWDRQCNAGVDRALPLAEDLRRDGVPLEIIDTTEMGAADLQRKYIDAIMPSVFKKYRVRQVFGSRRRAGWLFGRGVPALVVLGPNSSAIPEDLYPREERGTLVTIWDFLASLRESKEKAKTRTDGSGSKGRSRSKTKRRRLSRAFGS